MDYECITMTIIDANVMKISFIVTEETYGAIDVEFTSCHGYYISIFYSYTYTLQVDFNIDDQVIYSDEIVCKGSFSQ